MAVPIHHVHLPFSPEVQVRLITLSEYMEHIYTNQGRITTPPGETAPTLYGIRDHFIAAARQYVPYHAIQTFDKYRNIYFQLPTLINWVHIYNEILKLFPTSSPQYMRDLSDALDRGNAAETVPKQPLDNVRISPKHQQMMDELAGVGHAQWENALAVVGNNTAAVDAKLVEYAGAEAQNVMRAPGALTMSAAVAQIQADVARQNADVAAAGPRSGTNPLTGDIAESSGASNAFPQSSTKKDKVTLIDVKYGAVATEYNRLLKDLYKDLNELVGGAGLMMSLNNAIFSLEIIFENMRIAEKELKVSMEKPDYITLPSTWLISDLYKNDKKEISLTPRSGELERIIQTYNQDIANATSLPDPSIVTNTIKLISNISNIFDYKAPIGGKDKGIKSDEKFTEILYQQDTYKAIMAFLWGPLSRSVEIQNYFVSELAEKMRGMDYKQIQRTCYNLTTNIIEKINFNSDHRQKISTICAQYKPPQDEDKRGDSSSYTSSYAGRRGEGYKARGTNEYGRGTLFNAKPARAAGAAALANIANIYKL